MISPYRPFAPHPALRPHVVALWAVMPEAMPPHRVLPDGHFDLLFTLSADGDASAELLGVMTRPVAPHTSPGTALLGVTLEPGQALSFVGAPLHELKDTVVDLVELWGSSARRLASMLWELPSTEARVASLSKALRARLEAAPKSARAGPLVRASLDRLRESNGRLRTSSLARELGCSERRLERLFREHTGLPPKALARIFRFQAAATHLACGRVESLATVACDFGFYDQAHLTNEFRRLGGDSPLQFMRMQALSDSSNHCFGLAERLVGQN